LRQQKDGRSLVGQSDPVRVNVFETPRSIIY
jgi:hypothetical protein